MKNAYRLCYVSKSLIDGERNNERLAYFHCWENYSQPTEASPLIGGFPAGIVSRIYGLVEFSDGTIKKVHPELIRFIDDISRDLYFYEDHLKGLEETKKEK